MADHDGATSRWGTYRRRLAAAALASLALHLLLARGLALTDLGLDGQRPAADAAPPPKPKADFAIRVSKSRRDKPAHERLQTIAAATPQADRPSDRPAERAATERRAAEPADRPADPAPAPAAPTPPRDRSLAASGAPARAAAAAVSEAATQADAAVGAAARSDATAAPAARSRDRDTTAAVASRWRPREVALLERLTAPAVSRPAATRDGLDAALPSATPAARAAAEAATETVAVDAVATPDAAVDGPADVAPAARTAAREGTRAAVGPRGTAAPVDRVVPGAAATTAAAAAQAAARARREAAATGSPSGTTATARRMGTASGPSTAADSLAADARAADAGGSSGAAPAPAAGSPRRGGAASSAATAGTTARAGDDRGDPSTTPIGGGLAAVGPRGRSTARDGVDGPIGGASGGPARAVAGVAAGAPVANAETVAGTGTGTGVRSDGTSGGGTAAGVPSAAIGPRSVGRIASGEPRSGAAVSRRPADGGAEAEPDAEDGELSVPRVVAGATGRPRDDEGPGPGLPRPPERVTVVALPAETRVRDVAEAFARRGRDGRPDDPRAVRVAAVVDRGLAFLAKAQQADGRWRLGTFAGSGAADQPELASDTAATGLALLAFLGAGHDHFDGPHRDVVRRGLEFLLATQKPDGDLYLPADDLSNNCSWLYSHGIASIALCEAVGMTGDPLVKPAARKACGFIAASQHPERGGWRYTPRSDADLSVSGWMLVAVRSGALAGVETDPRTLAGVRTLLDAAAAADDPTRYAYNPRKPDQRASELSGLCMTAVGALMRLHTGAKPDDPRVAAAARALAARRPAYDARNRDSYLWYYASQVLVHTGGPEWDAWYAALVDTLATTQETAGNVSGSWDPLGTRPDRWGRYGGRIYVTALHLLALEVPERRLPTYTAAE